MPLSPQQAPGHTNFTLQTSFPYNCPLYAHQLDEHSKKRMALIQAGNDAMGSSGDNENKQSRTDEIYFKRKYKKRLMTHYI